jgi:Tol biopolymer transport system component
VVFASWATNLVAGDTNGQSDVFVRDRRTGRTELVSVSGDEQQGNGRSDEPTISADGRTVAFVSQATNLAPADGTGGADVFVRDLETGTTELVSVGSDGRQGDGSFIGDASLSADGRYVAFQTPGSLAGGDWSFNYDVYVRDRLTATTTWASDAGGFSQGAYDPMMSADGSAVAFYTSAAFVPEDDNGTTDIYVRDLWSGGGFERVSVGDGEQQGDDGVTEYAAISADGRYVAFGS